MPNRSEKKVKLMKDGTIKVDYLARVEGEGSLYVRIKDKKVSDVKFKIFEPPRFFEAFLRGRMYYEAPDITARICGICPIAYQMGACHAMEDAFGVTVDGQLRALRRLIYCGEWIESHALHVFMLHAPDFLGYEDAIRMAADHPDLVKTGLRIKKIGNRLMTLLGGREIHPINVRVGGFYKVPEKDELQGLVDDLKWGRDAAIETARTISTFNFPEFEQDYELVALRHPEEYPFNEGQLVSNKDLDIPISEFEEHIIETHVAHSTSLQAAVKGRGTYLTGPLARYSLNYDKLPEMARQAARDAGLGETCTNPFKSIIVRMVEIVFAFEEALRIVDQYEKPDRPSVDMEPRRSVGYGCTEAPRGICYHRYRLDDTGVIEDAGIVPPTSQNQGSIEEDLRQFVPRHLDLSHEELTWKCEQAIRNYDPCISCSCHFLKLTIDCD